jgi:Ca2+-binding EF-hand superfamily protein/ferredoxin-NADP reductase
VNPSSEIDAKMLKKLERAFAKHAGPDAVIDPAELQKALGMKSDYLAKRVFSLFDTNGNGKIEKDEFLAAVKKIILGTPKEKLEFAFRLMDHDGDGAIDKSELQRMVTLSLAESTVVARTTQPPEQLVSALLAAADKNGDGRISFDELEAVMQKHPDLLWRMTRSEATWIAPNEDLFEGVDAWGKSSRSGLGQTLATGFAPFVVVILWMAANVVVFMSSVGKTEVLAPGTNPLIQVGRALGACLDLNGALILIPMMRKLLSRIRATWLGKIIPVDNAISFHKLVGHSLFALACAHTAAFLLAYGAGHTKLPFFQVFMTARGATGGLLLVVFLVMWIFSLGFVRRGARFELFYFTHLLYVAWLALAIAHAPTFLMFAGVPIAGFLLEQVLRLARRGKQSPVTLAEPLRSGVTHLRIQKPKGFDYDAGDYAFLKLPGVAKHEWHPFTISSAPEANELSFHVRVLGNWTHALRQGIEQGNSPTLAYVDGPYGSPSAHIFNSKVCVLVGAGIGVTPFASVLESIVLRGNGKSERPSKLEKVHFFWLNKDQYSFEWFTSLLSDLEAQDQRGMLEVNLCMTGARSGATSLGLDLARQVMHQKGRSDIITGLRTKTHFGPPDFETWLGRIANAHSDDKVEVFFCGPPGLGKIVRATAERLGMGYREERF